MGALSRLLAAGVATGLASVPTHSSCTWDRGEHMCLSYNAMHCRMGSRRCEEVYGAIKNMSLVGLQSTGDRQFRDSFEQKDHQWICNRHSSHNIVAFGYPLWRQQNMRSTSRAQFETVRHFTFCGDCFPRCKRAQSTRQSWHGASMQRETGCCDV